MVYPFGINPRHLDPFNKTDLGLWDCFVPKESQRSRSISRSFGLLLEVKPQFEAEIDNNDVPFCGGAPVAQ